MGIGSENDDQPEMTAGEAMRQILEESGACETLVQYADDLVRAGCPLDYPSEISGVKVVWYGSDSWVAINTHLPAFDVLADGVARGGADARAEAAVLAAPGRRAVAMEIAGPDHQVTAELIGRDDAGPWMMGRQREWDDVGLQMWVNIRARRIDSDWKDLASWPARYFGFPDAHEDAADEPGGLDYADESDTAA